MTEEVESYSKEELFQLFNEYEKQKYRKYYLEIREKKYHTIKRSITQ